MVVVLVRVCPGVDTTLWTASRVDLRVTPATGTRHGVHDQMINAELGAVGPEKVEGFDPDGLSYENRKPFVVGTTLSMVGP